MKLVSLNCENLFINPPEVKKHTYEKPREKVRELARAIEHMDADILFLQEVGGEISLEIFNQHYLKDRYHTSLIPGNSDRGIELGYLIKKDLPYFYQHLGHRKRAIGFNYPHEEKENARAIEQAKAPPHLSHKMSRDIAELRIIQKGSENPLLIILGVHLKSKWDKQGIDFEGRLRRRAELEFLIETYNILNHRYKGSVPIVITGDFNGNAVHEFHDEEFASIYRQTDLKDILEVIDWPHEERTTFIGFDRDHRPMPIQMDYLFLPPRLQAKVIPESSGVFHYLRPEGTPWPFPQSPWERHPMPSDHFPVVATINFP